MDSDVAVTGEVIDDEVAVPQPPPVTLFHTNDPTEVVRRATEVATELARVVREQNLAMRVGNRGGEHVMVEGWTLLGAMLGVFPICTWTRPMEAGWEARVEARTMSGVLVGAAESQCMRAESNWRNRDDFALRSMAQTRATGKAMRIPLGWIMKLAGYDPTPAEEMIVGNHVVNTGTGEVKSGGIRATNQEIAPLPGEGAPPKPAPKKAAKPKVEPEIVPPAEPETEPEPAPEAAPESGPMFGQDGEPEDHVARLKETLKKLTKYPEWGEENVLANCRSSFGREILKLEDLSEEETGRILKVIDDSGYLKEKE